MSDNDLNLDPKDELPGGAAHDDPDEGGKDFGGNIKKISDSKSKTPVLG